MEKEFVPYEQALSLKEIDFDEPCFAYRDGGGYLMIKAMSTCAISAPTFSQAFRWFRDKYNIDCNVEPIGINKRFYSIYICFKNNSEIRGNGNLYETYEEAELECLNKLIEIVKNGKD